MLGGIATNSRRNLDKLNRLLTKLDERAGQQVEIETKFIEVQQGAMEEISFDWNMHWGDTRPIFDPRTGLPQIDSNGEILLNWDKRRVATKRQLMGSMMRYIWQRDTIEAMRKLRSFRMPKNRLNW